MVLPKSRLLGVTVKHPLTLGIVHALPGKLVLQLNGNNGDAVDRQHHINAVIVLFGIVPLADALADILPVMLDRHIIQRGFRLEITHTELDATVLKAMAEDGDNAIIGYCVLKGFIKLLLRVGVALFLKPLPRNRLCSLYKAHKGLDVQSHAGTDGRPVSGIRSLLPATNGGSQKGFDILFKLLFIIGHYYFTPKFDLIMCSFKIDASSSALFQDNVCVCLISK